MQTGAHDTEIQDQFTRQAKPFLEQHRRGKDALLELMAECAEVQATDRVLDVACGPGIITCFLAGLARQVTGLDAVPAMLEQAEKLAAEKRLENVEWRLGQAMELPFGAESFERVVTRFSFHHYLEPGAALGEMQRVCKRGGAVLVADVTPRREAQAGFNRWETLRDPSHTRALTVEELRVLGEAAGLRPQREATFSLPMDLEQLLARSFPKKGDAERIRALFEQDLRDGRDRLGVAVRRTAGAVKITYPVTVMAWRKG